MRRASQMIQFWTVIAALITLSCAAGAAEPRWVTYEGGGGPGKGKNVVLISGDEEYRSEEGLPQLGKILAKEHGFHCTVVFAQDNDGMIDPDNGGNIPGLEALDKADLMIIATRFRDLPDEQMKHIANYLDAGKPVIGLRTATHAFSIPNGNSYSKYSWNGNTPGWEKGFGRQVLGETWVNHWGSHKREATRGIIAPDMKDAPITRGLKDGYIFGLTDVYEAELGPDSKVVVYGQVLKGMEPTDPPADYKKKRAPDQKEQGVNDPMMPVAWTRTYKGTDGHAGRVFTTTTWSAIDMQNEGVRRLVVNGAYWCVGMEDKIPEHGTTVDIVGDFHPSMFGFKGYKKGTKPADYEMKESSPKKEN